MQIAQLLFTIENAQSIQFLVRSYLDKAKGSGRLNKGANHISKMIFIVTCANF